MADVRYNFVATGQNDVVGAFRGIEESAKAAERATRGREARTRAAATVEEKKYKDVEKYAARVQKELDREVAQKERSAKRAADVATREAKRAADAETKEAARGAKATEREAKRAANTQIREAKRAAKESAAAHEHVFQIRQRYEAGQQRLSQQRVARFDKGLADFHGFDATPRGILKDAAMGAVGFGTAALGIVGGAAREGMRLQDTTNRLSIGSRGAGEAFVDASALRREFQAAALETPGVKAADLAEGAQSFVGRTGDLAAARRFSRTFATISSASGASVQDIAGAGADLSQKFGLKSEEEMRAGLSALYFQGKSGSFELKDAASQFPKLGAAAERFGGMKGLQGLKTLGGLTQLARDKTGGPEQAATAVEAMFRQLIAKSSDLTAMGASPFVKGSTTKTRNIQDVLVDVISKTGGSQPKLQKIFDTEGIRGISGLMSTFNETKDATKGTETEKTAAGVAALRAALDKAINAPGDWAEVVKDSAQSQRSASAQLDGAWEQMKAKVSDRVIPALTEMVPKLTKMVDMIDPAITVFQALAESGALVVDIFKTLGLIKDKQATPEEKVQKAQRELGDFQAQLDGRNHLMTGDEVAKKRQLQANLDAARGEALGLTGPGDKIGKSLSVDAFAQRYAELGGGDEEQRRQALLGAKGLGAKIASGQASDYVEKNDTLQSFMGENEAQQRLRQRFQSDAAADQNSTGGGANEMKNAADKLVAAASKLEAAAGAQKQPSVFNGR